MCGYGWIRYEWVNTTKFPWPIEGLSLGLTIRNFILLLEKFLQFDWLRAVVFQLNLKYLHVKITTLLRVVV